MTERLEKAMRTARALPASMQDEFARIVQVYAGVGDDAIQLTADGLADLDESDAALSRGERATEERMQAIWSKYGP